MSALAVGSEFIETGFKPTILWDFTFLPNVGRSRLTDMPVYEK